MMHQIMPPCPNDAIAAAFRGRLKREKKKKKHKGKKDQNLNQLWLELGQAPQPNGGRANQRTLRVTGSQNPSACLTCKVTPLDFPRHSHQ